MSQLFIILLSTIFVIAFLTAIIFFFVYLFRTTLSIKKRQEKFYQDVSSIAKSLDK